MDKKEEFKKVLLSSMYGEMYGERSSKEGGAKVKRTYQLPEDIYHDIPSVKEVIDKKKKEG